MTTKTQQQGVSDALQVYTESVRLQPDAENVVRHVYRTSADKRRCTAFYPCAGRETADALVAALAQQHRESECTCPQHGRWIAAEGVRAIAREFDVAMHGESAAKAPLLIDVRADVLKHIETAKHAAAPKVAWDGKTWMEGTAGGCNVITYNGEDVCGVAYIPDDAARAKVIALYNGIAAAPASGVKEAL